MRFQKYLKLGFLSLLAACSQSNETSQKEEKASSLASLVPINAQSTSIDMKIKEGLAYFDKGDLDRAGITFNIALQSQPSNATLHFFNGFVEHTKAVMGKSDSYDIAETAYKACLNLDPAHRYAALQLGHLYFEKKNYPSAQEYFSYTALFDPKNISLLKNLAIASYYARDLATAYKTIQKVELYAPQDPGGIKIAAMIYAASKQSYKAQDYLQKFKQFKDHKESSRLQKRLEDWQMIHESGTYRHVAQQIPVQAQAGGPQQDPNAMAQQQAAAQQGGPSGPMPQQQGPGGGQQDPNAMAQQQAAAQQQGSPQDPAGAIPPQQGPGGQQQDPNAMAQQQGGLPPQGGPQVPGGAPGGMPNGAQPANMAIVDLVMLRTEETAQRTTGNNILNNLNVIFGGAGTDAIKWSRGHTKFKDINGEVSPVGGISATPVGIAGSAVVSGTTYGITRAISFSQLTYALNIANVNNISNEVLVRPTLIALDGRKSSFFTGDELIVGLTGNFQGQLDRDRIGIHFAFTPRFLADGKRIEFDIEASRSFPERNLIDGLSQSTTSVNPLTGQTTTGANNGLDNNFMKSYSEIEASVVMEFGQTLILAGISEKEIRRTKEGFPVLKDIPVVQYFFSRESTNDFIKSLIILMTPRKPGFRNAQDPGDPIDHPRHNLDRFLASYVGDIKIEPNIKAVFAGLENNIFYREFRNGDLSLERWFHTKNRRFLVEQTLNMLYF
jgi:tetratricopeptide (TPR) repeat protein